VVNPPIVAIVDDDASVRRALQRLIRSAGYIIQTFASAHEFLGSLPTPRAACLVLDIQLPGMSGFDLQKRLAADGVGIPVIFITAYDTVANRTRAEESGAAGYLCKPVDETPLLDAIRRACLLD
jgi:FixJ family two-component response regulator